MAAPLQTLPSVGLLLAIALAFRAPFADQDEPDDSDMFDTALMLESKEKRSGRFFDEYAAANPGFTDRLLVQVNLILEEKPGAGTAIGILSGLAAARTLEVFSEAVKAYPVLLPAKAKSSSGSAVEQIPDWNDYLFEGFAADYFDHVRATIGARLRSIPAGKTTEVPAEIIKRLEVYEFALDNGTKEDQDACYRELFRYYAFTFGSHQKCCTPPNAPMIPAVDNDGKVRHRSKEGATKLMPVGCVMRIEAFRATDEEKAAKKAKDAVAGANVQAPPAAQIGAPPAGA